MIQKLSPLSVSSDHRRTISNILRAQIKDVNFYEAKKGAVLGNHFHKNTKEYFFITKGSCIVRSGDEKNIVCKHGIFVVEPNTKHSIECVTDLNFLTFLTEAYDEKNPDVHK